MTFATGSTLGRTSMRRSIQAGLPRISRGAATSWNSRCCTMWKLYR